MTTITHLSHASSAADGGIATVITELRAAQCAFGLSPAWCTADQHQPWHRDRCLVQAVKATAPQLVHLHGLWRSPTRIARRLAANGLSLVIAPHGMLDPGALAISRRKKQLVWRLWEHDALQSARCLHALCSAEADAIRSVLPDATIAVIPNGVQLPERPVSAPPPWLDQIPEADAVLLFLGRFHHKKGLEPLLKAWQSIDAQAQRRGWWLAMVGYGDQGALEHDVAEARARGELERVRVFGPVFGDQKAAALAAATAFVLPSFSEGLPMAALEAMAYQRPCLLSGACNLPEAFASGAALQAEPDALALAAALLQCFDLSHSQRAAMGMAGHALVRERFSWPQVAEQTRDLYRWIRSGGVPPAFVYVP